MLWGRGPYTIIYRQTEQHRFNRVLDANPQGLLPCSHVPDLKLAS